MLLVDVEKAKKIVESTEKNQKFLKCHDFMRAKV